MQIAELLFTFYSQTIHYYPKFRVSYQAGNTNKDFARRGQEWCLHLYEENQQLPTA